MRVDEIFDRLVAAGAVHSRLDLVMQRREFAIHLKHAILPAGDDNVSALTFEHVHVIAERRCLDFNFGKIRLPLSICANSDQADRR